MNASAPNISLPHQLIEFSCNEQFDDRLIGSERSVVSEHNTQGSRYVRCGIQIEKIAEDRSWIIGLQFYAEFIAREVEQIKRALEEKMSILQFVSKKGAITQLGIDDEAEDLRIIFANLQNLKSHIQQIRVEVANFDKCTDSNVSFRRLVDEINKKIEELATEINTVVGESYQTTENRLYDLEVNKLPKCIERRAILEKMAFDL